MEKEFVPYDLAVKLKALGFDERCLTYYENEVPKIYNDILGWDFNSSFLTCVSRPTFSQAFRWFREKCWIHTYIGSRTTIDNRTIYIPNGRTIPDTFKNGFVVDNIVYTACNTYEEADFACLTKLIEIVESKTEII